MAIRAHTTLDGSVGTKVIQWTGLLNGDTGEPYEFSGRYADKSVQVSGTFGTGGKCVVEGSNFVSSPVWATLNDAQGSALEIIAAKIKQVLENTNQIRPNITAGDGTTSLTVTMCISS